ncbi:MAG TPA: GNAT family N-acetyltransferase [Jatrophihabitans sp.]|nr:GNAT family N-acetyltransferase [Jatrophihabitans sp.]
MSRVNVRIRPATHDDIPALVALVQNIDTRSGLFSGRPLHDSTARHLVERFAEILDSDRVLLLAQDESERLVGMLAARDDEVGAIDVTPVLHVTHLMVDPQHRRRGVGRLLLAAAVRLADERGIEHLLTTAAAGSREGNRYLARIGFAPLVVHRIAPTTALHRSLGMADVADRMASLRRARLIRAQRTGFVARVGRRQA